MQISANMKIIFQTVETPGESLVLSLLLINFGNFSQQMLLIIGKQQYSFRIYKHRAVFEEVERIVTLPVRMWLVPDPTIWVA